MVKSIEIGARSLLFLFEKLENRRNVLFRIVQARAESQAIQFTQRELFPV